MHDRIFKYELNLVSRQHVSVPKGSKILSVQSQNERLCLWAMVDQKEKPETRVMEVVGTEQAFKTLDPDQSRVHLETLQQSGMVWHIFEIVNK